MDDYALGGEYFTVLKDGRADVASTGNWQYKIDLHPKVTILQTSPKGGKSDETVTSNMHIHGMSHKETINAIKNSSADALLALETHLSDNDRKTSEVDNNIKALRRGSDNTIKE